MTGARWLRSGSSVSRVQHAGERSKQVLCMGIAARLRLQGESCAVQCDCVLPLMLSLLPRRPLQPGWPFFSGSWRLWPRIFWSLRWRWVVPPCYAVLPLCYAVQLLHCVVLQ